MTPKKQSAQGIVLTLKYKFIIFLDILRIKVLRRTATIAETIAIFGSPRTGTTWIMEIVSKIQKGPYLFEPFNLNWFPEIKEFYDPPRPMLLPDSNHAKLDTKYRRFLSDAFQGKIYSKQPFIKRDFETLKQRLFGKHLTVKFVRANRMIPWISKNFKLATIILIIRNPLTTIASQLKRGITGYFGKLNQEKIENVKNQAKKYEFLPLSLREKLDSLDKEEQILAIMWALDYLIPLKFTDQKDLYLLNYEEFMLNKDAELSKLYAALEIDPQENAVERNFMEKPSMLGVQTYKKDQTEQLNKWTQILSNEQTENILHVLELFDMNFYGREPTINKEKFKKFIEVLQESP